MSKAHPANGNAANSAGLYFYDAKLMNFFGF